MRVAEAFHKRVNTLQLNITGGSTLSRQFAYRDINDRIQLTERCFVSELLIEGVEGKNVLHSFVTDNIYAGAELPGVYEAIGAVQKATKEKRGDAVRELAAQISHVQRGVQCATSTLRIDHITIAGSNGDDGGGDGDGKDDEKPKKSMPRATTVSFLLLVAAILRAFFVN